MNTQLETAITVLRERIRSKEEDLVRIKRTVNEMCEDAGQQAPYTIASVEGGSDISSIRSDQFYGNTISGSAKAYLEMRKAAGLGAASVNDIYAALKKGGFKFEAKDDENAKNGLRISLRKNSNIFHRLPEGNYGLLAWYPNAKPPKGENDEEKETPAPTPAKPSKSGTKSNSVEDRASVKAYVASCNGSEITVASVHAAVPQVQREKIFDMLAALETEGVLQCTQKGKGRRPAIFKRKEISAA